MENFKLFDAEYRLLSLVWNYEPVRSMELSKLCSESLGWKKSTTFNMIRKLCDRQILKNENAVVTSLVKKEHVQKYESDTLIQKSFDGSLPSFLASFLKGKKITQEEAKELTHLIEEATK